MFCEDCVNFLIILVKFYLIIDFGFEVVSLLFLLFKKTISFIDNYFEVKLILFLYSFNMFDSVKFSILV